MKLGVDDMCFACGRKNPIGLKLGFHFDGDDYVTTLAVRPEYQGWTGIIHGGLLATALDMAGDDSDRIDTLVSDLLNEKLQ